MDGSKKTWARAAFVKAKPWAQAALGLIGAIMGAHAPVLAASPHSVWLAQGNGIPQVQYGNGNTALGNTINSAMENIAATIRYVLGATALVVILAAAVMNHFVQDPRAKERAKELVAAAVVGLLLAAFAPQIVNFIAGL